MKLEKAFRESKENSRAERIAKDAILSTMKLLEKELEKEIKINVGAVPGDADVEDEANKIGRQLLKKIRQLLK